MTESTQIAQRRGRNLAAIILGVILLATIAGAAAYYMLVETPLQRDSPKRTTC